MKAAHFKYSALTLALIANFAVTQSALSYSAEIAKTCNKEFCELKDQHIADKPDLSSISITNVKKAILSNISIAHSSNQSGVIDMNNTNVSIDGLTVNSTNPASLWGLRFENSTVTINNAEVNVATKSSDNTPRGMRGALALKSRLSGGDSTTYVSNSSFTNRADQSAVVVLAKNYAIFDEVTLKATGDKSTLFSLQDDTKLVAKRVTAENTQHQDGLFIHVDTGGLKGDTVKVPYKQDLQFEDSHIHAKQGIHWMDAEGRMDLSLSNSTLNIEDQLVKINGQNDVNHDITTSISLDRSTLTGGLKKPNSWVDISLTDSNWNVTSDSTVHKLSTLGGASNISFVNNSEGFKTLTITGEYQGAHNFHVNSNISQNQSDKVVLSGNVNNKSSATFFVTDQSAHIQFEDPTAQKVTLLESADLSNKLSVKLGGENQYVNAGGYRYRLSDQIIGNKKTWILTNQLDTNGQQEVDPDFNKPKVEEPKVEDPKVEDPKVEDPKVEDPKVEDPKVED
uniref:pertactin-like passenger domain-containing protein n=2 Tax=Lonepinella TaxID=53416 RepID=UPI003F6E37DD